MGTKRRSGALTETDKEPVNGDGPSQAKRPRKEYGDSTAPFVTTGADFGSSEMAVNTASPTSTIRSYGPLIALPSLLYHPALQPVEPAPKASPVPQHTSYHRGERPGKLSPQQLLDKKSGKAYSTGPFRSPLFPPNNLPSHNRYSSWTPESLDESQLDNGPSFYQHASYVPASYNDAKSDYEVHLLQYGYLYCR